MNRHLEVDDHLVAGCFLLSKALGFGMLLSDRLTDAARFDHSRPATIAHTVAVEYRRASWK